MLMRFEPFREFERMSEQMRSQHPVRQIPVDAYRRGNEFKIHLDLPGVDPDSIDLTVENDVLTVWACRTWLPAEGDQVQITERAQGEVSRQLFLGQSLDRDHLTATCENGVLTITIPMVEQAKPRRVEVLHAGSMAMDDIQAHGHMTLESEGALAD
jgi:HSP20 family protein